MEQRYILDATTVIYYTQNTLPDNAALFLDEQIPKGIYLSIIAKIELLGWMFPTPEAEAVIDEFVNSCIVIKLRSQIVAKTIEIRKNYRIKLPDAIIAATALVHDMTLISRNDIDFKRIPDLKYLNPFTDL